MAQVFKNVHTSDLSEWPTTYVDSGDLSWLSAAGLGGTAGGMSFLLDDTVSIYAQVNGMTNAATDYRYSFYVRNVSLAMGASHAFEFLWVHTSGTRKHFLEIVNLSGTISLRATLRNDASTSFTGSVALGATGTTGAFYEVHVHKAATNSSSDAFCKVYKDGDYGTPVISITGVDLFDDWNYMTQFRIGACAGLDSGTSGTFYVDEVTYRDDATQIGPNSAGAPTVVMDSPPGAIEIYAGDAVVMSATASGGTAPYKNWLWTIAETGSGVSDQTVEDPGSVTFPTAGVWTLTLTVDGNDDLTSTAVTETITVLAVVVGTVSPGRLPNRRRRRRKG